MSVHSRGRPWDNLLAWRMAGTPAAWPPIRRRSMNEHSTTTGNGNGAGNGNGPDGGGGSFVALRGAIGDALARGDAAMIGDLARSDGGALYTLAYAPEGGRLELFMDCDPVRPVAAFPVPMGVREALAATMAGP